MIYSIEKKGEKNDTLHCSSSMQSLRKLHGGIAIG